MAKVRIAQSTVIARKLHHLLQFVCYAHSRSMPIQSNCTKGRIAIAAVIQQKAASQIDFLSCIFNLCEIILQRSHPHRNCNLAKVRIAQSTVIARKLHHLLQIVCCYRSRTMPIQSNCTKGRIVVAAVIRQKATSQIHFLGCTFNLCKII